MSLQTAVQLAQFVETEKDAFCAAAEARLRLFHEQALAAMTAYPPPEARGRLTELGELLLLALAGLWAGHLTLVLQRAHSLNGLGPPEPYSRDEAAVLMQAGVSAVLRAAYMTLRTAGGDAATLRAAWVRQYEAGGAFTALRGTIRGSTAGTFTTLGNASVIDTARVSKPPEEWILGAYNPLDERTEDLDWRLCLNTGQAITTNRKRVVRSIPGLTGKYTLENAWVPGPPAIGGDTHWGCRCWLVLEQREQA